MEEKIRNLKWKRSLFSEVEHLGSLYISKFPRNSQSKFSIGKPIDKSKSIYSNYLIDKNRVTKICLFANRWLSIAIDWQCFLRLGTRLLWLTISDRSMQTMLHLTVRYKFTATRWRIRHNNIMLLWFVRNFMNVT